MSKVSAIDNVAAAARRSIPDLTDAAARNFGETFLRYSDDLASGVLSNADQIKLANDFKSIFGATSASQLDAITKNADEIGNLANKGLDGLPEVAGKLTTEQSKNVLNGAETLAKRGELGTKQVDEGIKLGDDAKKAEGGLWNWIKNNPKYLIVGFTLASLALYISINYLVNGKSPADSFKDLLELPAKALAEIASLLASLVSSFAKAALQILKPLLIVGLVIGAILLVVFVVKRILNRKKKKSS